MSIDQFARLNDKQREAVFHTEGPLLILAGAGAGKTRVLTHRIAYLIEEKGVAPYNIMAITFTNKAAQEMKDRVANMVDFSDAVWIATFHSSCVRILRRHIDCLGYDNDFSIYDADDARTAVKHVIKEMDLDPKMYRERAIAAWISSLKNDMITPEQAMLNAGGDFRQRKEAEIYQNYQKKLKSNNALDFDDLLILTVQLFRENPVVLEYYQNRFRYIMVDEYQDTNRVQFEFVALLAASHHNICVVGDDDQSIYRFRGADIRNILEFEAEFPGAKVVRLEQNYRSTTRILDAANSVIRHNRGRKEKHLWSELGEGQAVSFSLYENGYAEAESIIRQIRSEAARGADYYDYAVLYRTNAQSRAFEEKCIAFNVPYRLVGGVNFYQRQEIKDMIAYLKTIDSGKDDLATQRILNVPRRGIGDTTVMRLQLFAEQNDLSLMETVAHADRVPGTGRVLQKLSEFAHLIGELRAELRSGDLMIDELIRELIDRTNYYSTLDDLDEEKAEQKKENIDEFISKAADFVNSWEGEGPPELTAFLEEVALVADVDAIDDDDNRILLMTLHSAKGLEFPTVFLAGLEDGLFPSYMSLNSGDPMDIEEERRLMYVGITRAMKRLFISAARARTMQGNVMYNPVSRFVKELPEDIWAKALNKRESSYSGRDAYRYSEDSAGGPRYGGSSSYGGGSSYGGNSSSYKGSTSSAYKEPPKPTFGRSFEIKKASSLPYGVGDRVRHMKFGEGTVLDITDGKKDHEVLVRFDTAGERRLFASFARLEKI
ncbi:MAG: UvrD-helicase domain-containing protein [Lachnospiraceae bacterium]|nr:UvrD-helicase domain-containing protein [Lachnospiraceae bacterium]